MATSEPTEPAVTPPVGPGEELIPAIEPETPAEQDIEYNENDLVFEVKVARFVIGDGEGNEAHGWDSGIQVVADADDELRSLVGNAGMSDPSAVRLIHGADVSGYQSQEDAEAALAEAMGEPTAVNNPDGTTTHGWTGPWHEANLEQGRIDEEQRAAALEESGLTIAETTVDTESPPVVPLESEETT